MDWKNLGEEILETFSDAMDASGRGRERALSHEAHFSGAFKFEGGQRRKPQRLHRVGEELDTLAGLARRAGISPQLVRHRMKTRGWTLEAALFTPKHHASLAARARAAGLDERTVRKRIACGMSVDAALAKRVAPRPAMSIADRARAVGRDPGFVQKRVRTGWALEDALTLPKCAPQECRGAPRRRAKAAPERRAA